MKIGEETEVTIEKGKTLSIKLVAIGELNARGEREVFFDLNGQMRTVFVQDKEASKVGSLAIYENTVAFRRLVFHSFSCYIRRRP